jgi:hypothetical protein
VSAADKREELEARLWRLGLNAGDVAELLAGADAYAEAVADERIAGRVVSRIQGRERLAVAVAEVARRAS